MTMKTPTETADRDTPAGNTDADTNTDPRSAERLETTSIELDGETIGLSNVLTPGGTVDTYTAAFYIEKGGVGKTTSTATIARALADDGYKTVVLGFAGKQSDLSHHFGIDYPSEDPGQQPNIATAFKPDLETFATLLAERSERDISKEEAFVEELAYETEEGVDVIPSHQQLDGIESYLKDIGDHAERYSQLDTFVEEYLSPLYDAVLFDLPGGPSEVSYAVLWAAKHVVVPASPGTFEEEQIKAIKTDLDKLRDLGRNIDLTTVIPTKIETTPRLDREFVRDLLDEHGPYVAPAFVPKSNAVGVAQKEGRTVYTDEDPSNTSAKVRAAYRHIASDLLARIELFEDDLPTEAKQ